MTLDEAIIHAKETAKKLRVMTSVTNGKPYDECLECAKEHEQLASWLTELQERRETDKWIPVSERLPEEETDVLVCNGKGDMIVCRGSRSTEIKDEFIWYVCDWRYGEITHWKPLPEPYESEATSKTDSLPNCNSCAHNGTWNCIKCSGFDRYERR